MELIDTHCHLYVPAFAEDIDRVIDRATSAGVSRFYLPAIDQETEAHLFALEQRYPGICLAMQGIHPCSVKSNIKELLKHVENSLSQRRFVAIGETGLDFYWDRSFEKEQFVAFHQQIEWAEQYSLPVIIHSRNSIEQTISVVKNHQKGNLRGIFHCFNEDEFSAREIISLGFLIGIGGAVTYKNSKLPAILKEIPLENIVLETDSPYLPPVPYRGKRNESSYLIHIAEKLAEIKGLTVEEIARITSSNAKNVFPDS